jgi:hypothetical protein
LTFGAAALTLWAVPSILVVVGIAVAVLGAFVLLRFPDRPGGRIAWQGLEVSSVGAGLPLIVVGIAAIAIGGAGVGTGDSGDGDRTTTGAAGGGCKQIFDDVPNTRRALIELGVDQRIVVGAAEPKDGPVALTLTERERPVAYVRLDYLAQSESFRVDDVVDPDCDPVDDYQGSKANADVLQTYDDLSIDVGGRRYVLNVNGGSDIRVRLARG